MLLAKRVEDRSFYPGVARKHKAPGETMSTDDVPDS